MKKIMIYFIWIIAFILTSPLILVTKIGKALFNSDNFFRTGGQIVSLIPGDLGIYMRSAYYKATLEEFYLNGNMLFGALISSPKTQIGHEFGIGSHTSIGYAKIGNNVIIANKVSILSGAKQHNFDDPEKGILEKEGVFECVTIGDDVFIGDLSVVMANIGEKSIIGAGSIVVKDIPPYSVAVGNPAKVIKTRK